MGLLWECAMNNFPRFLNAADQAVIVEFGETIDDAINARVINLDANLSALPIDGMLEATPTFRSLCVHYDTSKTNAADVVAALRNRVRELIDTAHGQHRVWQVPVVYGGMVGPDLEHVAIHLNLTTQDVISLHSQADYRVGMIGFLPGYPYLSGLPEALHISRRTTPHPGVPAGSITIGGAQASIYSAKAPTGWHVLGRTPLRVFDPRRSDPFLLRTGDEIRFHPISESEAAALDEISETGGVAAECVDVT